MLLDYQRADELGAITQPTLIIAAPDDQIVPFNHAQDLARRIAQAQLVELAGGHFVPATRPVDYAAVVERFLQAQVRGTRIRSPFPEWRTRMRLANKVAIITGAGAGIGAATAELFVHEGAKVLVADRDGELARAVAARLGDGAQACVADVSKSAEVEAMVAMCVERFGGLDILFNNAGFGCLGTVETLEEQAWDELMAVDLKGVYLCSKYAIPHLRRRGKSSIVNMASTIAVVGIKDRAAYVAAKGGVAALTRAMALDHAADGIRVNSIAPGVIETNYYDRMFEQVPDPVAFRKALEARSPLNRMGRPVDIASMALWLASDEADFATGAMFTVDGGYTAW